MKKRIVSLLIAVVMGVATIPVISTPVSAGVLNNIEVNCTQTVMTFPNVGIEFVVLGNTINVIATRPLVDRDDISVTWDISESARFTSPISQVTTVNSREPGIIVNNSSSGFSVYLVRLNIAAGSVFLRIAFADNVSSVNFPSILAARSNGANRVTDNFARAGGLTLSLGDDSLDACRNCNSCGFRGGRFGFGMVTNDSAGLVVRDAIAILRYLVELPSVIRNCPDARAAAAIVNPESGEIVVQDAIAILRSLLELPSVLDDR